MAVRAHPTLSENEVNPSTFRRKQKMRHNISTFKIHYAATLRRKFNYACYEELSHLSADP